MGKKSKKSKKARSCTETLAFLDVVRELRQKCPWDKKQTHTSLSKYLLEEAYEAAEAMNSDDPEALKEELGDVLLQVALHSEIASEKKWFDFESVAEAISEKMIRRHPHVFGDAEIKDYASHMKNWTRLKQKEKPQKKILEGIPKAMPALQLAQRYGEITSSVGFDWKKTSEVIKKVKEELKELEAEIKSNQSKKRIEEELGDVLFALAQVARHLGTDAERSLKVSSSKFAHRFEKLENKINQKGKKISDLSEVQLEKEWQSIKRSGSI
ncbi:nucleoside triphosphate pyrophosphohydrolase [bacterium]|nr:nucleoside triphosphate pyrophosphohydrolase [bacterium]